MKIKRYQPNSLPGQSFHNIKKITHHHKPIELSSPEEIFFVTKAT